jgi:hypothetical protein
MIKEMDDVPNYFNLHPMTTMLTEDELKISNNVNIGEQICVNLNSWMNEPCVA